MLPNPGVRSEAGTTLTVVEAAVSQAETWTTKEILDSLAADLARLNNNERPFLLGATVYMSPVLANAISYTFNGVPYSESCARQRKALFEEARVADDARARFKRAITKLRAPPSVGSASAPPLVGSSASQVAGSSDPAGVPAFKEKDVLGYVQTSNALELRYTEEAMADLQRAEDARASDSERESLDVETAAELAALRDFAHPSSANWLRMRSTALFHCLSHKAKAAVRAAKYSKRFRMLGPAQGWAVVAAYGLIVTPFGKRDLHCAREPSPFVGPKDSRQLVNFYRVVIEVMRMSHIAADPDAWPEGWKEVVRVRQVGCTEPAPLVEHATHATRKATEAAREAAFVFEIFAGTTRVLHATIRRSRVVTGAGLRGALKALSSVADSEGTPIPGSARGISTLTSPTATTRLGFHPHVFDFGDADVEREELGPDEGITDDVNETYKNIGKEVSEERYEDWSQKLNDDDALCDEMAFDDVVHGWTASQAPPEKEEGDNVTGIIRTKAELVVDENREDTTYFQNPIYMEVERKIRGKLETFFPLASLVAFHARLALTTGPCVRALFPDFVHTSSHVEGKFSEARQEHAGNMPLDAYLEVRCARGKDDDGKTRPSLFDCEAERYRMSIQNANRGKLERASPRVDGSEADEGVGQTPAAGEVWKGVHSGKTQDVCSAKVASTGKQCINKAQKACILRRCGKHKCGRNDCGACGAALPERSQLTIRAATPAAPTSREGGEDRDAEGARRAGARVATGIEAAADDTNGA